MFPKDFVLIVFGGKPADSIDYRQASLRTKAEITVQHIAHQFKVLAQKPFLIRFYYLPGITFSGL